MSSVHLSSNSQLNSLINDSHDEARADAIVNAFYGKAYEIARYRMDSRFLRRFTPSSVANTSVYGLVESVSR